MKIVWFKRVGWLYLPISVPGAIIALSALAFCVQVFLAVDHKSHSVTDTLLRRVPIFRRCISFLRLDCRSNERQMK